MSSRTPIQVPIELKEAVEEMKGTLRAGTHYEVIEKLIRYYNDNEQLKREQDEQRQLEKQKQQETMIYLGEELKRGYMHLNKSLGFASDASGVQFLIEHYENSLTIDKKTFDLARTLK
ncbi:hypothetical protein [uncultured Chitinophaga sp.]|jgi:hypothetical protein|uniref:hypothetical protein n=1 Tax=uncultured Chitinophaga sp. TaxID=339340 RepID=UPI00262E8AFB|nr:hypothetical protein [uncultured Chitinophaga sp.]